MTEIVKNNNSLAFELLETGNNSANASENGDSFTSVFKDMGSDDKNNLISDNKDLSNPEKVEKDVHNILNIFKDSDLNITKDLLHEIRHSLEKFLEHLETKSTFSSEVNTDQSGDNKGQNFLKLMKFLEQLREMIGTKSGMLKNQEYKLDSVLDSIRAELNRWIKNSNKSEINERNLAILNSKEEINSNIKPKDPLQVNKFENFDTDVKHLENRNFKGNIDSTKIKAKEKIKFKDELSSKQLSPMRSEQLNIDTGSIEKTVEKFIGMKIEPFSGNTSKANTFSENIMNKQPINVSVRSDANENFSQVGNQKSSIFSQETNGKLLADLNMLSKSWGTGLIKKIEKSISEGIEELEISLVPKSLGRLNIIINIQDSLAKVNIIAESASAAALLSEAESKLSQMMEQSGLRLASLQTLTQQFGNNQKGKDQSQKLASIAKKSSIVDRSNPEEEIKTKAGSGEGLNLIA
ncbi:flagellar hook-length control protein FliK [Paracoccaceae bacterium]|nr:flagellar hook-length control protein FliK [Paracoccaceae bacterium]